jgi:hypothetical protein
MHAVRANYDHLSHQRTQFYGNLWYKDERIDHRPIWKDLIIKSASQEGQPSAFKNLARKAKRAVKKIVGR